MHQIQEPSPGHRDDAVFGIVSGDYLCSNWMNHNTYLSHYSYLKKVGMEWADEAAITTPVFSCSAVRGCAHFWAQASKQGTQIPCADPPQELWLTTFMYILCCFAKSSGGKWCVSLQNVSIMHSEQTFLLISMGLFLISLWFLKTIHSLLKEHAQATQDFQNLSTAYFSLSMSSDIFTFKFYMANYIYWTII